MSPHSKAQHTKYTHLQVLTQIEHSKSLTVFKRLWKSHAMLHIYKVLVFSWRLIMDRLSIEVARRNVIYVQEVTCCFCKVHMEDIYKPFIFSRAQWPPRYDTLYAWLWLGCSVALSNSRVYHYLQHALQKKGI